MKRLVSSAATCAILLAFITASFGQSTPSLVTMHNAATATGNGTELVIGQSAAVPSANLGAVGIQITGTFSGTVTFEASSDGTNWTPIMATNLADDVRATTATAAGHYTMLYGSAIRVRARISAYSSGTITVKGRLIPGLTARVTSGGGGGGGVTSVAQSFTGGLISVGGSPITTSGTLALTVAGTSGGVPYFSSTSTWASSAALAANAIVIGGGAGAAPSTTTTAAGILTFLGTPSSANLASAVTDETGSGALVFGTSPRITTSILDANGNSMLRFSPTASATQSLAIANNTATNAVSLIADAPTAAAASQAGTGVEISASAAIAGTSTAGAATGGSLTLRAGAGARLTSGNANGGTLIFIDGTGVGTGVRGGFAFGGTSSSDTKLTIFSNGYSAPSLSLQTGAGVDSLGSFHSGTASYGAAGGTGSLEIAIVGASGGRITVGGGSIGFASASATGIVTLDGNRDTEFTRAAAKVMAFGNGTAGHTFRSLPDSPAQITADQNNYQAGSGRSYFYRLSSDASRNITGFNPAGGTNQNGETHVFINVGSNNIVLVNESASSTAANRFTNSTGADITLAANEAAMVFYDGTASRWRVFKY